MPERTTFYYDPIVEVHHRLPVRAAMASCFYSAPQVPDDTRRLFDAALRSAGLDTETLDELKERRSPAIALALSREWRLSELEARLSRAIEAQFEPTWDRLRGEFTWGLRLREEHPRGQFNAFLAAAEALSPGAWARLSEAPLEPCPQVVGLDFPNVALSRAVWDERGLDLRIDPLREDARATTAFRVEGADAGRPWRVTGRPRSRVERDGEALVVTTPLQKGALRLEPAG